MWLNVALSLAVVAATPCEPDHSISMAGDSYQCVQDWSLHWDESASPEFAAFLRDRDLVGIGLVTNNVVSIDIEGYDPAGEFTPDLYARSYSVAAGNTPSGPATNDSKWLLRPYVSDSLEQYKPYVYKSWNPRRPKLWAVAIRKNVAWL